MRKIELEGYKYLYGLTDEERSEIKDDLLVENPAYEQAKKHSRFVGNKIPKYLQYYLETHDFLQVPLGYKQKAQIDQIFDLRVVSKDISYPEFQLELRETQVEAVGSYLDDTERGIISMPTGKGKSIVGIYLAYHLKQKALVIVHKDDLVTGWQNDINLAFGREVTSGLIKAKKRVISKHITIATVQTLNKFTKEDWDMYRDEFGLIIVDEMHHAPASSYSVMSNFNAKYRVGLSATPERSDGLTQVMHYHFGDFAYVFKAKKGEEDKDILPVNVYVRNTNTVYRPLVRQVKPNKWVIDPTGDLFIDEIPYNKRPRINFHEVDDFVIQDRIYLDTLLKDLLSEYKDGRNCLLFVSQKEHCRLIFDHIRKHIPQDEIVLYYGDAQENSSEMMQKIESGEYKVTIATYKKATEGTNVKAWEVAFLVSSVNNGMNIEQAVGRIRRVKDGKIKTAKVYDYRCPSVYTFSSHGSTRDTRYRKLGFKIFKERPPMFSRGYKSR